MSATDRTPLTPTQLADLYFIEHRAKLLDLAALLDRCDRAGGGGGGGGGANAGSEDARLTLFRRAIPLLVDGRPDRARRILELFSDVTPEPIERAGTKGAIGVWAGAVDSSSAKGGVR